MQIEALHILREEIRSLDLSRRALRSFGLTVGGVLLLVGLVIFWRRDWTAGTAVHIFAGTGIFLAVAGAAIPGLLRPLYRIWMGLAVVLGYVMTRVILTAVFFLVVVPIGLLMRLFGRDPLHRELSGEAPTYWIRKQYQDDSPRRLERYF
jgi:hypothetical protein